MKRIKIQGRGRSDEFQTPNIAIDYLLPFLWNHWIIWEPACGNGNIVDYLWRKDYSVISTDIKDGTNFLKSVCVNNWDCIVTNPPYSLKDEFLERCYELGKPFALLLPLTALEGQRRQKLYKKFGIQLIIPNRRINFETESGKGSGAWFQSAWFCWGLNLPKDLNFVELPIRPEKPQPIAT